VNNETPDPVKDEQMINAAFRHLLDTYLASNHRKKVEVITKAFNFAKKAHSGVRRLSGEPYIMHPIAVAQIVCEEIGLGSTSICAALLHDVEEDTDYTNEDIANLFGPKVANIVEGLTKISGGIFGERASLQAETFKKLLLTMSDDIRVILIKIADRLHNMRTLSSMLPSKQYKIAGETLYIYAPLADRLGLNKIKNELEDLSFHYEHPQEYEEIKAKLAGTQAERQTIFDEFTAPIRQELDKTKLKYHILARVKTPYSIWQKMQNKHITFEEIYDILAIRIVFEPSSPEEEVNECFNIYVALCRIYKPQPDRLRDWISHPKANGYQALHVTLMSNRGEWIEVQIRSKRMDDIDEQGVAAHWKYKSPGTDYSDDELSKWLHTIKEILDDPQPDTLDFLDTIKLNLFANEILIFTPKGEIKTMPAGSTALDFAFSIHSFLGSHCIGAKVNHKLVPLSHKLQSGDQVEILTSRSQHVQPDWIQYANTAKAKSKIRALLRRDEREKRAQGEEILRHFLQEKEIEMSSAVVDKLCRFHEIPSRDGLLLAIGEKSITLTDADAAFIQGRQKKVSSWKKFIPFIGNKTKETDDTDIKKMFVEGIDRKKTFILNEDSIKLCKIADCCHPIPGDDAMGYIDPSNEFIIHRRDCPIAEKLKSNYGNRVVAVEWQMHHINVYPATIYVKGIDVQGILMAISEVIYKKLDLDIKSLNVTTDAGIFESKITINLHDTVDVKNICSALLGIKGIVKAVRIN
jgi:GTP pyrophosphokinase